MTVARRVALLLALAALLAAALAGTTAERDATKAGEARRLPLLRRPARLREGAGEPLRRPVRARRPGGARSESPPTRAARQAAPQQGVDYSGTNVQEEGVDEPDLVKTDGHTVFAVANGRLNAVDVRTAKPRLLDTLKLDADSEPRAAPPRRPPARALARRLLGRAAARDRRPDRALRAGRVRPHRGRRLRSGPAAPRPHADARRRLRRRAPGRRQRTHRLHRPDPGRSCRSSRPRSRPRTRWRPRRSATAPSSPRSRVAAWLPSYRIKRAGAKAGPKRALVQCRHVQPAAGLLRASACSPC